MRAEGHAVDSLCRVLREQGGQVAARTYLAWTRPSWAVADNHCRPRLTPEGLYGRQKITALVRRSMPGASPGTVDQAMRSVGLQGIRRGTGMPTTIPAKGGKQAGDLLEGAFTAAAPNRIC